MQPSQDKVPSELGSPYGENRRKIALSSAGNNVGGQIIDDGDELYNVRSVRKNALANMNATAKANEGNEGGSVVNEKDFIAQ